MSVQSFPHKRLPDQISIGFGPPDILGPLFLKLDRAVRDRGIYLSVSHDLDELVDINKRNLTAWYPLLPMFNPNFGGATGENTFWIRGVNERGEVVLTQAARLYFWPDSTLDNELETQGFFYADPSKHAHFGEHCIVGTKALHAIRGRTCFTGGLWFHPSYRGRGLAHIMPRLTRAYAVTTWYPEYFFSILQKHIVSAGMPKVYGWRHLDGPVLWRGCPLYGDLDLAVGWMDTDEAVDDLANAQMNGLEATQPSSSVF